MANSFSGTARSERHFTALLLPHLLMSNNFAGAHALFAKLGLGSEQILDHSDIEIVAELNPIRDMVGRVTDANTPPPEKQGQVVPDLFLRIGNSALVIEAKFFTHPAASTVADQLSSQRAAITEVLPHTEYARCSFHYLALTVLPLDDLAEWHADSSRMTWSEVISVLEPVVGTDNSTDTTYALMALKDAVERSSVEADTSSKEKGRVGSIGELLQKANALLESRHLYVGFVGGQWALDTATVEDLENRQHYKYSDCQPNKNWLPLHSIISHYLKLKAEKHAGPNI